MIKLLNLVMLVAFLFAVSPPGHNLIVNDKGILCFIPITSYPQAVNVVSDSPLFAVEASCNSPPANS